MLEIEVYRPKNHVRVVTATSLFDGHDVSINIMRRIMQDAGVEVIHLGHNRSAAEIVEAAVQEDVQGIAVSCYQGGHVEFFQLIMDLLRGRGSSHVKVFGGGGGVIVPDEIAQIEAAGVSKIFSPEDGRQLGLQGMINLMVEQMDFAVDHAAVASHAAELASSRVEGGATIARYITAIEEAKAMSNGHLHALMEPLLKVIKRNIPILGVTGTGGAGKSSLVDELVTRFLHAYPSKHVAIISVDPSRRRFGGALLGDRIRMNCLSNPRVYLRSLATRAAKGEISDALGEALTVLRAADFDFIIVETAGIGQGDAAIVPHVDTTIYVTTAEYGAPSQLEKIDMLDFADLIVINKFDHKGGEDALRDVRKQYQRNHRLFDKPVEEMPVFGTVAAKFNDEGVTALLQTIVRLMNERTRCGWDLQSTASLRATAKQSPGSLGQTLQEGDCFAVARNDAGQKAVVIPPNRVRYLAEVADTIDGYHNKAARQADTVEKIWQVEGALSLLDADQIEARKPLEEKRDLLAARLSPDTSVLLERIPVVREQYSQDEVVYTVRGKEIHTTLHGKSLSGTKIPRVALPKCKNPGDLLRWISRENLPGRFPFTAGVFPFKRDDEDPARMFAGEGCPERTNRRFKFLSGIGGRYPISGYSNPEEMGAGNRVASPYSVRLSTAFDSVTLYGFDPDTRPDIYGKIGTSGVSICTLDDMKILYDGFDLCGANTSVSMTINGPAPIILAMFFNTAIDQQLARIEVEYGRSLTTEEIGRFKAWTLHRVRGTVQADILKEDQGQNTCIFAIDFALKMMGDIQEYFIKQAVRNFYSVSISGYHIAEAGANPISQLAFTLANGFTYVEYYLSRGMDIDDFVPNFSFFFSNGMDPEYSVLNRVARRIWAVAMRDKYGASERSQKLKAHIQTSGRSLHSHEIQFNDIRTTLQALTALYDHCNSLHTNSYDEGITTPSEESVRRAQAIQLIINREFGLSMNENPLQGSFLIEELTDLVEEAVLREFRRISEREGVLGAMETGYQRSKIQEESLYYEERKMNGALPIIGVNTFINPNEDMHEVVSKIQLARASDEEKQQQIERLRAFQAQHAQLAPAALQRLQRTALDGGNIFEELMETVRHCSLGQITKALFEVGGQYRRNM